MWYFAYMAVDKTWLLEEKYGGKETAEYEADTRRLAGGEPLAYVIGWQPFLGLRIYLDSRPLIPRTETEWWTDQMLSELARPAVSGTLRRPTGRAGGNVPAGIYSVPRNGRPRQFAFLDLCAGSGAIGAAALARLPNAQVYFGEMDPAHEWTIRKNIRENGLDGSRAHVCIGDLFEPFAGMTFDVIAANPPYVPIDRTLPASVALYEPQMALQAGADGLDVIRRIAAELPQYLEKDGVAWIECDRGHAEATRALFEERGFRAEIRTDQYDKPRIVVVTFANTP